MLRTALHESLSLRTDDEAWYDALPLPRWQSQQILDAEQRVQKMHKPLTAGRIVAELTFGFWVGFLTKPHMTSGLAYYIAKTAFVQTPKPEPGVPKLAGKGQPVRNLRNRVFHQERILHWQDLEPQHNEIMHLIGWINPELEQLTRMLDRFTTVRPNGLSP